MTTSIQSAYVVDGKIFATKAEATAYTQRPKILEALNAFIKDNADLTEWLLENQEGVETAFESGTIKRVTKSDRKAIDKALAAIVATGNTAFDFVIKNADAIAESFRWPAVKRMSDEEKAAAAVEALTALTADDDGETNEQLANFVASNREKILEAYKAGKPKREVSQKASEGLAKYHAEARAKREAAKAAEEAASE